MMMAASAYNSGRSRRLVCKRMRSEGSILRDYRIRRKTAFLIAAASLTAAFLPAAAVESRAAVPQTGIVSYLPGVTDSMIWPDYWLQNDPDADAVLADWRGITALNSAMLAKDECNMNDLRHYPEYVKAGLPDRLYNSSVSEFRSYMKDGYYDRAGNPIGEAHLQQIMSNIQNAAYAPEHAVQYGIAVRRADLRAYPTDEIVTDELGDIDFDYVQLSSVRVNDPLILLTQSADGRYYYAATSSCDGWILSEDVAICSGKGEWLGAWDLSEDRTLVVTDNRIYLEESNTDPAVSGLMIPQGSYLELMQPMTVPSRISNRSPQQNYAVYVPVRNADGSYGKRPALISQHYGVSAGYLPLTRRNILRTAFRMLGDTYGWGGMLSAEDCSGYVRGVYRCFGLELPRNTTWQAQAPAVKYDLSGMSDDEKKAALNQLPAGTTLFFRGHEMIYLGTENGNYYVISSVSSAGNPFGPGKIRIRSVVINTLDMKRANNTSWLSNLYAAVIPYQAG